ncbi:hypothetical protein WJX72_012393 [[Myrmecia] bisecta]|uniref:Potassium transporter n=1 Tax=[Myrmecia] bisecta TaxID=41462 RepID=A0AAW1P488_9CHLO
MSSTNPAQQGGEERRLTVDDAAWNNDADLDAEADAAHKKRNAGGWAVLGLAYSSFGIIYGDIGTSPLYVFSSIFNDHAPSSFNVYGAMSLIFWTMTVVVLFKYVFIVLCADDHGEGGTFAMYSLLCRTAGISPTGGPVHKSDLQMSHFKPRSMRLLGLHKLPVLGARFRGALGRSFVLQKILLVVVLFATCMVIGDGILTPAISVLSAVEGLQVATPHIHQNAVMGITCAIIVVLFAGQRYGTRLVGRAFAPIILLWLLTNAMIGIYNIAHHCPEIFKALNPAYAFRYLVNNKKAGWDSLGGVLLSITGAEAMFADLGHFSKRSIQLGFGCVAYPCLMLTYLGQAAYLQIHPEHISTTFYKSIPHPVFWPMFVIATSAAVVASQALISGCFSIIRQSMALNCFPRVKIVHTSSSVRGQIYIPEVNYALMLLSIACVLGFQDHVALGNAYGVAVVTVMLITTVLMTLVMLMVWETNLALALVFLGLLGAIEAVPNGGWFSIVIAFVLCVLMYVWHWGAQEKSKYGASKKAELENLLRQTSPEGVESIDQGRPVQINLRSSGVRVERVPGVGLFYADNTTGVPPVFMHLMTKLPAAHEVLVLITIRNVPVPEVAKSERILVKELGFAGFYRCIARYGYMDVVDQGEAFVAEVLDRLEALLQYKAATAHKNRNQNSLDVQSTNDLPALANGAETPRSPTSLLSSAFDQAATATADVSITVNGKSKGLAERQEEALTTDERRLRAENSLAALVRARAHGITYVLTHSILQPAPGSGLLKRFMLDGIYLLLARNCRSPTTAFKFPNAQMVEVGMVYEI